MKKIKSKKRVEEAVKAFKPKSEDIKIDTDGSYTGVPEDGGEPIQDSDDL